MSTERLFCDGWEFSKNPIDTEYKDAAGWKPVDIPHDWLIYQVKDLYETSTGWYRRTLVHVKKDGMRTSLRFEGVYMDSRVFVNGELAGEWKYGYSTFEFDITDRLRDGENLIAVRVDYRAPNSRWYSGAGIYRRVWLKEYPDCHLASDGVYISADASGKLCVSAEAARPEGVMVDGLRMRCTVFDGEQKLASLENALTAADISTIPEPVRRVGCKYSVNNFEFRIPEPIPWDIEAPHLYRCVTELIRGGEVIDRSDSKFGFRSIEFTPDRGFFLNGRHVKIHGCCQHHDLGALGAAVNVNAVRRQLEKLRVIGINAIRTTHNMPAVELMELCDEMGFLVMSEGFDMWERRKTEHDYAGFFTEWIDRDVASWIRRDRNHPCIIGWSVGNEIYDTHADEHGQEIVAMLADRVRRHDPRRNAYITHGSNYMQWENARKCADILKLAGYNYAERLYDEHHAEHPDWMIYGSETSSVLQSRGIYHFPLSEQVLSDDDEQCSALGNTTVPWGAKRVEDCIIPDRDREYCAGQFIWTGWDYIGEPTPYATKNCYFGQIDTAGFYKDSAYIFRGAWTDFETAPFVHVYPYWDFSEGQTVDVRAATNAPLVKLFLNGKLVAEKRLDHKHGGELTLDTVLSYTPGELTAVAYDENGIERARDTARSFGNAERLVLTAENSVFRANGTDLMFIDVDAYDKDGVFVANANNRVTVSVEGAGRLIGLDNGDSTDYDEHKGVSRRLFSGRMLAIVAATDQSGEVVVRASSRGLPDAELRFNAEPAEVSEGVSFREHNAPCCIDCTAGAEDVPVRRIDLSAENRMFTPERREITVDVKPLPENASYKDDIEFRITNVQGIASGLGEIASAENGRVTVRCKGDGVFYLRALCKNGTDKYHVISVIEFKGEGLGAAFLDPYELMIGGLFTVARGAVTQGIDKGAAFKGKGAFGFENVDFGDVGSDTVTVPIFADTDKPVGIRFYDGIPDEGGELIGDFKYQKPPVWMVYTPETFKLNKTLRGVHTFVIASDDAYDVRGAVFEKKRRERAELCAANAVEIFGDKFTKNENDVTGIGNNVVLKFGEFDFDELPPEKVVITGRSALAVNSIHIIFGAENGNTETRVLAEFAGAEEYTAREFPVNGISGRRSVSIAFLPGSDFDFGSLRFE
ncbi:MAG: DUF4982 domain-containing protein [Lachnospiraceae bacterium]|nr:DUF4982 domain-containing protein [Ruminococcus sp.]MCM1274766.1 DUF4982 domain-containing protein [Lachnospiraceae bacterium]